MKKRVRIYKAGGEQGEYMNKTAQFLMKAQLGAERSTEEKMVDSISQAFAQGMSPEEIFEQLTKMGIDEGSAAEAIQYVMQSMQPEEEQPEAQEGQEVDNPVLAQYGSFAPEEEVTEEEEVTDETADNSYLQVPSLNEYIPEYIPMAGELETYDIDNPFADMLYAKNGGRVSKRNFVKNVMNLVKKQNGGDAQEAKADFTDVPVDGRAERFNNFLGAVKSSAQNAILKKAIGNMYNDMMQDGGAAGETQEIDLVFSDSKNTTDPYFKHGGLHKYYVKGQVDNNNNDIPDYLERNYVNTDTQGKDTKQDSQNPFMSGYTMPGRRRMNPLLNPFGNLFYNQLQAVGDNKNIGELQFDPSMVAKPTNVDLRRSGRVKEMDMVFDPSNKYNITSITDAKFRRSGMPKSFTINYKSHPASTEANPAYDFMLSQYVANKEKQAEKVTNNGAPTGPRVSEDADKYDGLNVRKAKRLAKDFETPNDILAPKTVTNPNINNAPINYDGPVNIPESDTENYESKPPLRKFSFYDIIPASQSTEGHMSEDGEWVPQAKENIESAKKFIDSGATFPSSFAYGGYYAYGGDLPEYQGQQSSTVINPVAPTQPASQPVVDNSTLKGQASATINRLADVNRTDDIGRLEPRKVTEGITDKEGLVNIGNTPKAELEGKNKSITIKNKRKIDPTAALDNFNAAANVGLGFLEDLQSRKANQDQWYNYNADNLYASNNKRDRGTYEVNSGLFRPDEMGFNGVIKFGGPIFQKGGIPTPWDLPDETREQMNELSDINMSNIKYPSALLNESKEAFMRRTGLDKEPWAMTLNPMYSEQRLHGALPGSIHHSGIKYEEGGEAYMTDEEIENFLAEGGELEFIND